MKIFIIGSLSCEDRIKTAADFFFQLGYDVEYVKRQPEKTFEILVEETFNSIFTADIIIAVTKEDGTFGQGTTYEIMFAKFLEKIVIALKYNA